MRQGLFEAQHRAIWQQFEQLLERFEQQSKQSRPQQAQAQTLLKLYGDVCQHLALAQQRQYSAGLMAYLQQLAARGHSQIYRYPALGWWQRVLIFVRSGLPETVRSEGKVVWWAHVLFYAPLLLAMVVVLWQPALLAKFAGADVGGQVAQNYQHMADDYARGVNRPLWLNPAMFGVYVFNNIGIAFQSFASGLLLGIGTVYTTVYNGLLIGGIMGFMTHQPSGAAFFSFVGAHGAFELTGLVLAAAGGLRLGLAVLMPGQLPRAVALKQQGARAVRLMSGAFLFLAVAALIEGFWSPLTSIPMVLKWVVGAALWLLVYAYLLLAGRHHGS